MAVRILAARVRTSDFEIDVEETGTRSNPTQICQKTSAALEEDSEFVRHCLTRSVKRQKKKGCNRFQPFIDDVHNTFHSSSLTQ